VNLNKTLAVLAAGLTLSLGALAQNTETLPSGVKIVHTTPGTGASPQPTQTVKVHYKGTLTNGQEFDSSYKRGAPFTLSSVTFNTIVCVPSTTVMLSTRRLVTSRLLMIVGVCAKLPLTFIFPSIGVFGILVLMPPQRLAL
jgi:hypothetical protein